MSHGIAMWIHPELAVETPPVTMSSYALWWPSSVVPGVGGQKGYSDHGGI